jgi:F-type H+-transporting ATPase subunit delta
MNTRASADRYARALLDVVAKEANPEQVQQELAAFAQIFSGAELNEVLQSPAIPPASKRGIVEALIARTNPSAPLAKLLLMLAGRNRLTLVPQLAKVYDERLMELRQVVQVEVTTAMPMASNHAAEFEQRLSKATGRRVRMTTAVDPALIGGAVARIGTTVYDGSVANQLARMKERLAQQR